MLWPLDVFEAALDDLARFGLEREAQWSKHEVKRRMAIEQSRRRCRAVGIPPLILPP
jgi:hypothetical protein